MRLCSLFGLLLSNVAQISANGSGFVIRVLGRLRGLLPGEVGAQPSGNSGSTESKRQRPLAASADFRPWWKPAPRRIAASGSAADPRAAFLRPTNCSNGLTPVVHQDASGWRGCAECGRSRAKGGLTQIAGLARVYGTVATPWLRELARSQRIAPAVKATVAGTTAKSRPRRRAAARSAESADNAFYCAILTAMVKSDDKEVSR